MNNFDERIADAFALFMKSYMLHNKDKKSALYMYEYETVIKINSIPLCKVVSISDVTEVLLIGEK